MKNQQRRGTFVKFLKYALAAAGAVVFAAAALVAYFVLTFDVRDHEPRIVALVKEKTGRTLTIRGETRLAFWPDLGVTLGPVTLSERDSDAVFAEVANARLAAKLRPLLSKELVADELHLEGASVRIVRYADGRLNVDDLLSGEGGTLDFDIARARMTRSRVVYEDVASGARHELSEVDLATGRLARVVTTPVTLSFKARDAAGTYAVSSSLQGRLSFDLPQRAYRLDAAAMRLDGTVAGVKDLAAKIDVGVLNLSGNLGARTVAIDARAAAWHARIAAPRVEWREGVVRAADATVELDASREGRTVHATVVAGVSAAPAARSLQLADVRAKFSATGASLPKRGIEGAFTGAASVDLDAGRSQASFAGTVLDSRVKAKVVGTGLASPSYTFTVDVDALDLDRLAAPGGGAASEGFDIASLSDLRADGVVRIGSLRSAGVTAKNVQLAMKP